MIQSKKSFYTGERIYLKGVSALRIALIGMMGAGKSTVGVTLAGHLGIPFVDLDAMIENATGMTISTLFSIHGEDFFRNQEVNAIKQVAQMSSVVCATGGGAIMRPEVRNLLKTKFLTVFLEVSPEEAAHRLAGDKDRPLLTGTTDLPLRIRQLSANRRELYIEASHYRCLVDSRAPQEIVEELEVYLGTHTTEDETIQDE